MTPDVRAEEAAREIGWQDIRLVAGEGKLPPNVILQAANVIMRDRITAEREACAQEALSNRYAPAPGSELNAVQSHLSRRRFTSPDTGGG